MADEDSDKKIEFKDNKSSLEKILSMNPPKDSHCSKCIAKYREDCKFDGKFFPDCNGTADLQVDSIDSDYLNSIGLSEDEISYYKAMRNPVTFAKVMFDIDLRWYQEEMTACTSKLKVSRTGRRCGKTVAKIISVLHKAFINDNHKSLIICPTEAQVSNFFEMMKETMKKSDSYSSMVVTNIKKPFVIALSNGSTIKGFTAGSKSGGGSSQIRGQDARCVVAGTTVNVSENAVLPIESVTCEHEVFGGGKGGFYNGKVEFVNVEKNKKVIQLDTAINSITCTPNHPIFDGEKDVNAEDATEAIVSLSHRELSFDRDVIIARLCGYNMGLGYVENGEAAFYSKYPEDLEQIIEDLVYLGDERRSVEVTEDRVYKYGIYTGSFIIKSDFIHDIIKDYCTEGCKVENPMLVPDFIMDGSDEIKASYLSGLMSSRSNGPASRHNRNVPLAVHVRVSSVYFNYPKEYLIQIKELFNSLGIGTSEVVTSNSLNNTFTWEIRVLSSASNSDIFTSKLDYCYAPRKMIHTNSWKIYRALKHTWPYEGTPCVADIINGYRWNGNYLKIPVKKTLKPETSIADVYNLQSSAESRFMASGMMTHNSIYIDEGDYINQVDYDAVFAILASHRDCDLWISSTPKGTHEFFWKACTNKELGYREFHHHSSVSPEWTPEIEKLLKDTYSKIAYEHEFLGEFSSHESGVFDNDDIDSSIESYSMSTIQPESNGIYLVGVDWNESKLGVHIVILQYLKETGKLKLVKVIVIDKKEFTQLVAVEKIININSTWNPVSIYCDAGFGSTQIQTLHKYGQMHPNSMLDKKVKGIDMGGTINIKDPITQKKIPKKIKPFKVGLCQRKMEDNKYILPREEDSEVVSGGRMGLIKQMRNFSIKKVTSSGQPIYSQGEEHTLTAFMLATMAFMMECTDLAKTNYASIIRVIKTQSMTQQDDNGKMSTLIEKANKIEKESHVEEPVEQGKEWVKASNRKRQGAIDKRDVMRRSMSKRVAKRQMPPRRKMF
jgi:hypothetical protein